VSRLNLLIAGPAIVVAGCSRVPAPEAASAADTVYRNGMAYTVNETSEWAEAVLILWWSLRESRGGSDAGNFASN
jgi:uncharacterized protein YceK